MPEETPDAPKPAVEMPDPTLEDAELPMESSILDEQTQITREIPQDLAQEPPQDLPHEVSRDIPQYVPQDLPMPPKNYQPEDLPMPQDLQQELPQELPQEYPQEIPQEVPQDLSQEIPQEFPQELPQDSAEMQLQQDSEMTPEMQQQQDSEIMQTIQELDQGLGQGLRVVVLGAKDFTVADSQEIVATFADVLSKMLCDDDVFLITAGAPGVQEMFARACGPGPRLLQMITQQEQASGYGVGEDVPLADDRTRLEVLAQIADVYVFFEDDDVSAWVAGVAVGRNVPTIRVGRTTVATETAFPPESLNKPLYATDLEWDQLHDPNVPPGEAGFAVANIVSQIHAARLAQQVSVVIGEGQPPRMHVCILGGEQIQHPHSEEILRVMAEELRNRLGDQILIVTGGLPGVQELFVRGYGVDGEYQPPNLWHMLPGELQSPYGIGRDINAGRDMEQRKAIFGQLGEVYICVEGDSGVLQEASRATARGAFVIPVSRTATETVFPPESLNKPLYATDVEWDALHDPNAPPADAGVAVANIVSQIHAARLAQQVSSVIAEGQPPRMHVCILGGTQLQNPQSEEILRIMAEELRARLGEQILIVTGGLPGVQEIFTRSYGAEGEYQPPNLWHMLPGEEQSPSGIGRDINAGRDMEQRKAIFGQLGEVYICVEGGPGVAEEANRAMARGALVIPVSRTGGASAGMFDFPPLAFETPNFTSPDMWALLSSTEESTADTAAAVAIIVEQYAVEANFLVIEAPEGDPAPQ